MGGRTDWDDVYSGMGMGAAFGSSPPRPSRQVNGNINGNHLNIQMDAPLASSSVHEHIDSLGHALEDGSSTYGYDPWNGRGSRERGRNTNRDAVIYDSESSSDEYGEVSNMAGIGLRNKADDQVKGGVNGGEIQVSGVTIGYSYSEDSKYHHPSSYAQGQERGQDFEANAGDPGMVGVALAPSDIDSDADAEVAAVASRFVLEDRSRRENPKLFDHDRRESDAFEAFEDQDKGQEEADDLTEGEEKTKAPTRVGKKRRERLRAEAEAEAAAAAAEQIQQEVHAVGQSLYEEEELTQGEEEEEQPFEEECAPVASTLRVEEKTLSLVLEAWIAGLIYSLTRCVAIQGPPPTPYVVAH